jgi:hypothetical protein
MDNDAQKCDSYEYTRITACCLSRQLVHPDRNVQKKTIVRIIANPELLKLTKFHFN